MSASPQDTTAVRLDITVEHSLRVFTEPFDGIKPRDHNLLSVPIERTYLERYRAAIERAATDA